MTSQFDIFGSEHDHEDVVARSVPLTTTQRVILNHIALNGSIRGVEAGVYVHSARDSDRRCPKRWTQSAYEGEGCCPYAATDGADAMKRLANRGLVRRTDNGWERTTTT